MSGILFHLDPLDINKNGGLSSEAHAIFKILNIEMERVIFITKNLKEYPNPPNFPNCFQYAPKKNQSPIEILKELDKVIQTRLEDQKNGLKLSPAELGLELIGPNDNFKHFAGLKDNYKEYLQKFIAPLYFLDTQRRDLKLKIENIQKRIYAPTCDKQQSDQLEAEKSQLLAKDSQIKEEIYDIIKNDQHFALFEFLSKVDAIEDLVLNSQFNLYSHEARSPLKIQLANIRQQIEVCDPKNQQIIQELKEEQSKISKEIEDLDFGLDTIWKEISLFFNYIPDGQKTDMISQNKESLQKVLTRKMMNGEVFPLIDASLNLKNEFIDEVIDLVSKEEDIKDLHLVIISVFGKQSSGKSTLLNCLFGINFSVKAGRCTKGINFSLVRSENFLYLVLDTEGLFSVESRDKLFDHQISTFCFSCSDFILINQNGELDRHLEDLLSISAYAMKSLFANQDTQSSTLDIYFILRNQTARGDEAVKDALLKIKNKMEEYDKMLGTDVSHLLNLRKSNIMPLPSRFNEGESGTGPMLELAPFFSESLLTLRGAILSQTRVLEGKEKLKNRSLKFMLNVMKTRWQKMVEFGSDLLTCVNIQEILIRDELHIIFEEIKEDAASKLCAGLVGVGKKVVDQINVHTYQNRLEESAFEREKSKHIKEAEAQFEGRTMDEKFKIDLRFKMQQGILQYLENVYIKTLKNVRQDFEKVRYEMENKASAAALQKNLTEKGIYNPEAVEIAWEERLNEQLKIISESEKSSKTLRKEIIEILDGSLRQLKLEEGKLKKKSLKFWETCQLPDEEETEDPQFEKGVLQSGFLNRVRNLELYSGRPVDAASDFLKQGISDLTQNLVYPLAQDQAKLLLEGIRSYLHAAPEHLRWTIDVQIATKEYLAFFIKDLHTKAEIFEKARVDKIKDEAKVKNIKEKEEILGLLYCQKDSQQFGFVLAKRWMDEKTMRYFSRTAQFQEQIRKKSSNRLKNKQEFLQRTLVEYIDANDYDMCYNYLKSPSSVLKARLMKMITFESQIYDIKQSVKQELKNFLNILRDHQKKLEDLNLKHTADLPLEFRIEGIGFEFNKSNFLKGFKAGIDHISDSSNHNEFPENILGYDSLKDELRITYEGSISESLGCKARCPFCRTICTAPLPHDQHSSHLHMLSGMNGAHSRKTKAIELSFCKSDIFREMTWARGDEKHMPLKEYLEKYHQDWTQDLLNKTNIEEENRIRVCKIWVNIKDKLFQNRLKEYKDETPSEWIRIYGTEKSLSEFM